MPFASPSPERLRIGILCHPTHGGSGVLASELALGLAGRKHEVHVFSHAVPPRLEERAARERVHLHLSRAPAYPLFDAPPHDLAMVSRILAVHERGGLDFVHAHYALPHAASALLAAEAVREGGGHLPVVTTLHGTDITVVGADPAFAQLVRFVLRRSDAVSCVSRSLAEETRATFFGSAQDTAPELEVIPNFVDSQRFTPERARLPGPPRVVHASNLRPLKRVPRLVEAFARATEPGSGAEHCELWVIGDGPELQPAIDRAVALGLDGRVRFLGQRDDLPSLLAGAAAFALASSEESFGLSALEAMASGVPPVACRVGGLPEVFEHGRHGFLVAADDLAGFASRLRQLCVDHALGESMGLRARCHAVERFAGESLIGRYESMYRRVRARASSGAAGLRIASGGA